MEKTLANMKVVLREKFKIVNGMAMKIRSNGVYKHFEQCLDGAVKLTEE